MSEEIEVVKVLVRNNEEEFLAVQKSDSYDWKAGKWDLPGGKIRQDESRSEAAKREIKFETGLEIGNLTDVVRTEIEEPQSEKPVVNCWIVLTNDFSGEIELSEEHQNLRWVSGKEFMEIDWHRDAGYAIPAIYHLEKYVG